MCGRYVLKAKPDQLADRYHASASPELSSFQASWNVYPTQRMPVIMEPSEGRRVIQPCRWGLIPAWSKEPSTRYMMINARSETLSEKPSYREAYQKRRCIVPANGFYEWRDSAGGKTPFYIQMKNRELLSMAGLYEIWRSDKGGQIVSFTIITTNAGNTIKPLHDRMPVILMDSAIDNWLHAATRDPDQLQSLLQNSAADELEYYQVSREVNSPKNQHPGLVNPVTNLFD